MTRGTACEVLRVRVVVLVLLAHGCGGPIGVKAPPGESSSSDGGGDTSGTSSGMGSSGGTSDPRRPPLPPFELPAGCGDGVITPGQYDCFFPVPIDWVEDAIGGIIQLHPLDLEGDGRDEMLALYGGKTIAVLRWEDGELELGPLIESGGTAASETKVQTQWDWNADGRHDVTLTFLGTSKVIVHPNLGVDGLGEKVLVHEPPPYALEPGLAGISGRVVLMDVDGNQGPELLSSLKVDGLQNANPAEDLVLVRRTGTAWEPVGEPFRWGPCGWLDAFAYGDFDRDGDEDVALLDHGQACDPYPSSYDPEWYRVWVLLTNSAEGVLELGGWYPTGGAVSDPKIWAEDVTGDGAIDLMVQVSERVPCDSGYCIFSNSSVMRGHGDGSFDEGTPVDLGSFFHSYKVDALIDVDGDGTREWIVGLSGGRPWVMPLALSEEGIAPMVALNDPEAGTTRFRESVGDINGDGITDYTVGTSLEDSTSRYMGRYLMVSAP